MSAWQRRLAARRAGRHKVTGFVSQPQPRALGHAARGRQYLAGNLMFAGQLVQLEAGSPWDLTLPSPDFSAALHGFAWLDDLAAIGAPQANATAQAWTLDWIGRFARGAGPGWAPYLVGRRQIRWITHAIRLMNGADGAETAALIDAMGRQALYLSRRWRDSRTGFARLEALVGYVHSASALTGMEDHLRPALAALSGVLSSEVDTSGGLRSRNPEELLEIFALLTWTSELLREAGHPSDHALEAHIARIAPVLRSLRHADGGLARFHGGGRGRPGLLDLALRQSRLRPALTSGPAMGFARLARAAVTVIADAAPPILGPGSGRAQASTLALQVTSGRHPVIVSCGAGMRLGPDWRRAGRASPSHSTLVLGGYSSSRMARGGLALVEGPREVECTLREAGDAQMLAMSHDGWRATHGLTHMRDLSLESDGRLLRGEDSLAALSPADREVFDRVLSHAPEGSLPYKLHFHLHPDVHATLDMGGQAISLGLKGGEVWVFRPVRVEDEPLPIMALVPSVYLDSRHLQPRATKQIVLSSAITGYGSAVHWSLTRPVDPPRRRRTLAPMIL